MYRHRWRARPRGKRRLTTGPCRPSFQQSWSRWRSFVTARGGGRRGGLSCKVGTTAVLRPPGNAAMLERSGQGCKEKLKPRPAVAQDQSTRSEERRVGKE